MDTKELTLWIACSLAFRGRETLFSKLLQNLGSVSAVLQSPQARQVPKDKAQQILNYCLKSGIAIIPQSDPRFPKALRTVDKPIVLYASGDTDILEKTKTAGVIGARHAAEYSLRICSQFTSQLVRKGVVIVSGFAMGIDRCAHQACINAGGKTVAVLGCGIGFDYPKGSLPFQQQIAQNGIVISEYPPLSKPERGNFPHRNRLIASLSEKLLVVQASDKSGCLSTVSHALSQGKDVFVVPPRDIFSPQFQGQVSLIRDGAQTAFEPGDLF